MPVKLSGQFVNVTPRRTVDLARALHYILMPYFLNPTDFFGTRGKLFGEKGAAEERIRKARWLVPTALLRDEGVAG